MRARPLVHSARTMSSSRGPYFSCSAKPERVARHEIAQSPRLFTAKPVLGAPLDVDDELRSTACRPSSRTTSSALQKASDAPEKLRANAELGYKAAAVGDRVRARYYLEEAAAAAEDAQTPGAAELLCDVAMMRLRGDCFKRNVTDAENGFLSAAAEGDDDGAAAAARAAAARACACAAIPEARAVWRARVKRGVGAGAGFALRAVSLFRSLPISIVLPPGMMSGPVPARPPRAPQTGKIKGASDRRRRSGSAARPRRATCPRGSRSRAARRATRASSRRRATTRTRSPRARGGERAAPPVRARRPRAEPRARRPARRRAGASARARGDAAARRARPTCGARRASRARARATSPTSRAGSSAGARARGRHPERARGRGPDGAAGAVAGAAGVAVEAVADVRPPFFVGVKADSDGALAELLARAAAQDISVAGAGVRAILVPRARAERARQPARAVVHHRPRRRDARPQPRVRRARHPRAHAAARRARRRALVASRARAARPRPRPRPQPARGARGPRSSGPGGRGGVCSTARASFRSARFKGAADCLWRKRTASGHLGVLFYTGRDDRHAGGVRRGTARRARAAARTHAPSRWRSGAPSPTRTISPSSTAGGSRSAPTGARAPRRRPRVGARVVDERARRAEPGLAEHAAAEHDELAADRRARRVAARRGQVGAHVPRAEPRVPHLSFAQPRPRRTADRRARTCFGVCGGESARGESGLGGTGGGGRSARRRRAQLHLAERARPRRSSERESARRQERERARTRSPCMPRAAARAAPPTGRARGVRLGRRELAVAARPAARDDERAAARARDRRRAPPEHARGPARHASSRGL